MYRIKMQLNSIKDLTHDPRRDLSASLGEEKNGYVARDQLLYEL